MTEDRKESAPVPLIEEKLSSRKESRWLVPLAILASVIGVILFFAFTLIDSGSKKTDENPSGSDRVAASAGKTKDVSAKRAGKELEEVSGLNPAPALSKSEPPKLDLISRLKPSGENGPWQVSETGSLVGANTEQISFVTLEHPLRATYQIAVRFAVSPTSKRESEVHIELPFNGKSIPFIIRSKGESTAFSFRPKDNESFGETPFGVRLAKQQVLGRRHELLIDVKMASITVTVNRSNRFTLDDTKNVNLEESQKLRIGSLNTRVEFFRIELTQ